MVRATCIPICANILNYFYYPMIQVCCHTVNVSSVKEPGMCVFAEMQNGHDPLDGENSRKYG